MNAVDLIRQIISVLDSHDSMASATNQSQPEIVLPQDPMPEKTHTSDETGGIMVPPLQQKLELLKKVAGEESIFNQPGDEDVEGPEDELSIIKRNAGIHPIVTHMASEDTDIES
jgi:hypothetical protein